MLQIPTRVHKNPLRRRWPGHVDARLQDSKSGDQAVTPVEETQRQTKEEVETILTGQEGLKLASKYSQYSVQITALFKGFDQALLI